MTVGQLKERLHIYPDDTQIRTSFRGVTPMGTPIDVSMPIQTIGNGCEFVDGEQKLLIYLSCCEG